MIELTQEQHESLTKEAVAPARVIDRADNVEYVLLRAELYERIKALVGDDVPSAALINEVMADDDANDPYLESYQSLRKAP